MSAGPRQRKRPNVEPAPAKAQVAPRKSVPVIEAEEASGLMMLAALKAARRLTPSIPRATRNPFAREVERALRGEAKTSAEATAAAERLVAHAKLRFA